MCRSPKLIAACHVLLRLLEPRHSLCALISLILIQIMSLALLFLSVYSSSRLAPVGLETAHHGLTLGYRLRFCLTQGLNGLRRSEHEIVFFLTLYPVCSCQRTGWFQWGAMVFSRIRKFWLGGGGPCWTRTSDPRLIKAVL
jgi:hypothetical protein